MNQTADQLRQVAAPQGGFFTAAQASDAGYPDSLHVYHVTRGNWIKAYRGIYRLPDFPSSSEDEAIIWSLWSRDRAGQPQGVVSHETAAWLHGFSTERPPETHLTVPRAFRKNCDLPDHLELHKADLERHEIDERDGYSITTRRRTALDLGLEAPPPDLSRSYNDAINAGED